MKFLSSPDIPTVSSLPASPADGQVVMYSGALYYSYNSNWQRLNQVGTTPTPTSGTVLSPITTLTSLSSASAVLAVDNIFLFPFILQTDFTPSLISLNYVGHTSGSIRMGIFKGPLDLSAMKLVVDNGTVAATTSGTNKASISFSTTLKADGTIYWLAFTSNGNVQVPQPNTPYLFNELLGHISTGSTLALHVGYTIISSGCYSGGFPSTLPTSGYSKIKNSDSSYLWPILEP